MTILTHRLGSISAFIVASLLAITLSAPAVAQQLHSFNISASDPASALHALSQQAGIQILASAEDLRGKKFNAVSGTLSTANALSALLAGTGLNYRYVGDAAVALVPSGAAHRVPVSATSDALSYAATAAAAPSVAAQPTAAGAPAPAATTGTELQEIVVTAERRQEDITKVPISITAITQQNIDTLGIKDFTDMAKYTPGVVIDTDRTNEISIRGISSSGGADTTGIYIDDTPIQTRTDIDALPQAFDVDRIEVLRGPQGTLFGAGAEGGAVRYITTQPSVTQSSLYSRDEISYTQGGANNYSIGVAGGMPLIDNVLGIRVTAMITYLGGWQDRINPYSPTLMNLPPSEQLASENVVDSNANRSNEKMFRLAVLWEPTQNWQITPSLYYQIKSQNDISQYYPIYSNPSQNEYYDGDPERYPYDDHFYLSSLKIQGNLGFADFISNSSYFDRYTSSSYGGTEYNLGFFQDLAQNYYTACPGPCANPNVWYNGLPWVNGTGYHLPDGFTYYAPAPTYSWFYNETQEFRLQSNDPSSKWQWTTGFFYELDQQIDQNWIYGNDDAALWNLVGLTETEIFSIPNLTNPNASWYTWENQYTRQYAVYGDASYAFTDQWKLDIGLRESDISYSFDELTAGSQEFGPPLPAGGYNKARSFTPKANLNFQATPNDLYYATYARGFRPGGANSPISYASCSQDFKDLGLTSTPLSYSSDTTESYEIGAKNNIANRLQLASAVYYIDWYHIQQFALLPICGIGFIGNLGQAVSKGADFQADLRATDQLSLNLAVGFTEARYSSAAKISPEAPTPIVEPGDAINGANGMPNPPWSGTLGLEYRFNAFAHEAFFRADDQYISGPKWLGPQFDPRTTLYDPYNYALASLNQLNLRTGVTVGRWEIDAFVNNLSDAHPITTYASTVPADIDRNSRLEWVNTIVPRTMGLTFIFHK